MQDVSATCPLCKTESHYGGEFLRTLHALSACSGASIPNECTSSRSPNQKTPAHVCPSVTSTMASTARTGPAVEGREVIA
jgi:hypothetical protein